MSFLAGAITSSLELDTSSFTGGMLEAQGLMSVFPSFVTDFLADPLLGFADLAKEAMSAVKEAFMGAQDRAEELAVSSANLGVSAHELSRLSAAASAFGVGAEESDQSFKFLSRSVFDATTKGGEFAESFRRLGIELKDSAGQVRPLQDILFDLSDAMAKPENASNRTGIAMELLGRAGSRMVGLLSQGSGALRKAGDDADAAGATISDSTAESAHQFGMLENQISLAWQGIQNTLAEPMRIVLINALQEFVGWLNQNRDEILQTVKTIASYVVDAIEIIVTAIENLKAIITTLLPLIGGVVGFAYGGPFGALAGVAAGVGADIYLNSGGGSSSSSSQRTTVNITADPSASTGQLATQFQQGLRQARRQSWDDVDLTARRMAIENGI